MNSGCVFTLADGLAEGEGERAKPAAAAAVPGGRMNRGVSCETGGVSEVASWGGGCAGSGKMTRAPLCVLAQKSPASKVMPIVFTPPLVCVGEVVSREAVPGDTWLSVRVPGGSCAVANWMKALSSRTPETGGPEREAFQ